MSSKWTAADVPDQSGRVAVVTGSHTGIGYEAAAVLAGKGAPTTAVAAHPGGPYYGPDGLGEQRGDPKLVFSSRQSHDEPPQRRLWTMSAQLTSVTHPV